MNDSDEELDATVKQNCPLLCNNFECIMEGKACSDECMKLDKMNQLICVMCKQECTPNQKKLLLDVEYLNSVKKEIESNAFGKIMEMKKAHEDLEAIHKHLEEKFLNTPSWRIFMKTSIRAEGNKIAYQIKEVRKYMDMLEITYQKKAEIK